MMPLVTRRVTISGVNGLLALGISALPGCAPNTVWYASIGHDRSTYEYLIGRPWRSRYGTTAVDSLARQSRRVNRAIRVRTAPPGRSSSWPADPPRNGAVAVPSAVRSSTSQSPSGSGVEKCTARPPASRTAAGSVAEVLTTTRSPGSSRSGSVPNA